MSDSTPASSSSSKTNKNTTATTTTVASYGPSRASANESQQHRFHPYNNPKKQWKKKGNKNYGNNKNKNYNNYNNYNNKNKNKNKNNNNNNNNNGNWKKKQGCSPHMRIRMAFKKKWSEYVEKQSLDTGNTVEAIKAKEWFQNILQQLQDNSSAAAAAALSSEERLISSETIEIRNIGAFDWSWDILNKEDTDPSNIASIEKHICAPSMNVPYWIKPSLPFRMRYRASMRKTPYSYPVTLPVYALALAAVKHYHLSLQDYDVVALRPSVKRIASISSQLNTNFQMINGILFAEDVCITKDTYPENLGYQFELYCTKQNIPENELPDTETLMSVNPNLNSSESKNNLESSTTTTTTDQTTKKNKDQDDKLGSENRSIPIYRKTKEYFQITDIKIGNLRMLLACEIDAIDIESKKPLELKFGIWDEPVSVWTQSVFSGIDVVYQAKSQYNGCGATVFDIGSKKAVDYYPNPIHQQSTLIMFHRIMEKLRKHCQDTFKETCAENNFQVSQLYRLTRNGDFDRMFIFKVYRPEYIINKSQWEYLCSFCPSLASIKKNPSHDTSIDMKTKT